MPRTATTDVIIVGQLVRTGEQVFCSLTAANRDETIGTDLDALNISRKGVPHVAFGHGIHHCIGGSLASEEPRIAIPALLREFPGPRLAVPFEKIPFRVYSYVYGVDSLPVEW